MKPLTLLLGLTVLFSISTTGFSDTCDNFSVNYTRFDLCSFSEGVDPFTVTDSHSSSLIFSLGSPNVTSCESSSDIIWGTLTNKSSKLECVNIAVDEPTYSLYGKLDSSKFL